MTISVIIATYNTPGHLRKAVWGWSAQVDRDFELVVADDGSADETRETIEALRAETGLALRHVWHEDRGFRKTSVLNKAIAESAGDYLIFSDGDCVPRRDFVTIHRRLARPCRFLSGGYLMLPEQVSERVTRDDIVAGRAHSPRWLAENGLPRERQRARLWTAGATAAFLDNVTKRKYTRWHGANSSGWRKDIVGINGFDERMGCGEEDHEFGERLRNSGVEGVRVRHRAVMLHLHHDRPYAGGPALEENFAILRHTMKHKLIWAEHGILKPSRSTQNGN